MAAALFARHGGYAGGMPPGAVIGGGGDREVEAGERAHMRGVLPGGALKNLADEPMFVKPTRVCSSR